MQRGLTNAGPRRTTRIDHETRVNSACWPLARLVLKGPASRSTWSHPMRKILLTAALATLTACGMGQIHSGADNTDQVGSPKDTSDISQALMALPEAHV